MRNLIHTGILKRLVGVSLAIVFSVGVANVGNSSGWPSWGSKMNTNEAVDSQHNPTNPMAPAALAAEKAIERSVARAVQGMPHAGMGEWVRQPRMFLEYGYTYNRDRRAGGIDADLHGGTLGFDFLTVNDVTAGASFSYQNSKGDTATTPSIESETNDVTGTIYASKVVSDNVLTGASFSYGYSDINWASSDQSIDTYTIAPYISFFKSWGDYVGSVSPAYIYSIQDVNYDALSSDRSYTGNISVRCRLQYLLTEATSLEISATPVINVQDNPTGPSADAEDGYVKVGVGADHQVNESTAIGISVKSSIWNTNYETYTADLQLSYSF